MRPLRSDELPQAERLDRRAEVAPEDLAARIQQTWRALEQPAPRSQWRWPAAIVTAAAICSVLIVQPWEEPAPDRSAWVGTNLESGERASHVKLADGSSIDTAPHTSIQLKTATRREHRFALRRGRAVFEVAKNPRRQFVVEAGAVEVRVIGTRFSVTRETEPGFDSVEVRVERGHVAVHAGGAGGKVRHLRAGDSWRVTEEHASGDDRAQRDAGRERRRRRARRARPTTPAPDAEPTAAKGARLFEEAAALRRQGKVSEAAHTYQRLLDQFPADGRAPLAAFELGRLRMDQLRDLPGAVQALKRALAHGTASPFRQDAMARLVRAYDELGQRGACQRARRDYLARYPDGRYARDVEVRCRP